MYKKYTPHILIIINYSILMDPTKISIFGTRQSPDFAPQNIRTKK